ncbi:nuclease-related domain-containing protein [Pseudoalteromonas sp. T1lg10]|uniref:nuclease-related domain-containing protein n=1 Tax=Pseudoalteromonas sp. T1lg10 TaxID=2077093 RepID=UPI000CF689F7|nr:nuclease-related domain-containing protein [Pseudoalteromonas sp. T1lg10]
MSNLLLSILPAFVVAGGIFLVAVLMWVLLHRHQQKHRLPIERSKLIRMPAQHLNQQIAETGAEALGLAGALTGVMSIPFLMVGFRHFDFSSFSNLLLLVVAFVGLIYILAKVRRLFKALIKLKLGRDAELASASELMKLQANGYQVFHDVQADGFNIDHLAVGPQGIFAVETKGRHKRVADEENGKKAYAMFYKDGLLHFPSWQEREPIEQAQRQAKWVNEWLIKATGLSHLQTTPVLAFPGWWVEAKTKPPFPIVNHKQLHRTLLSMRICPLSDAEISQISYQIVQRCTQGE